MTKRTDRLSAVDIVAIREERGLSQRKLAELLGVSHGLIAQIETYRKNVSQQLSERVIEVLDVQQEELNEIK